MKKRTTRIAATLFAATLAVTGFGGANLVTNAQTVNINESTTDHVYKVYQLFTGTVSGSTLSGIKVGTGLTVDSTLVTNLKAAFPSNTAIQALASDASAEAVASAIGTISGSNDTVLSADQKALVNVLRKSLTTTVYETVEYDKEKGYTTNISADGYYLIMDAEATNSSIKGDSATAYLLRVVDADSTTAIDITPKSSVPTVEKKVWNNTEVSDGGWRDAADYQVGETIKYKLTGTVASDYANYTSYFFQFNDQLSSGLDLETKGSTFSAADDLFIYVDANKNGSYDEGETELTADAASYTNRLLTVTFNDLKTNTAKDSISAGSQIVVEYSAKLNDNAVKNLEEDGEGNPNEVTLTYSNNPNYTGTGVTSPKDTTERDVVTVFTFTIDATKLQPTTETGTKALPGAIFSMSDSTGIIAYGISDSEGKITFYKKDGTLVVDTEAGTFTKDNNGTSVKMTIDQAGTYTLEEVYTPTGFTKVANIVFTVDATYELIADEPVITALTIKGENGADFSVTDVTATSIAREGEEGNYTYTTNAASFAIIDRPTSNLPVTGDSGRALYYAFGGMVAIAALLYLLREKKNA